MHRSFTLGMIIMLIFNSCSFDQDDFIDPTKGITTITFSVNMPNKTRSTYALTKDTENNISSIYVLAFKNYDGDYKLADWSATTNIKTEDSGKKTFATSLTRLKQGDSYKFVLLSNAKQELEKMALELDAEQDALLKLMQVSADRWIVEGEGTRDIPMWGETGSDVVIANNIRVEGISMVRMLAKININISGEVPDGETVSAQKTFKLRSVLLYNAHNRGHLVPASDNMESGSLSIVEKPTLVNGSVTNADALLYTSISKTDLTNTIYTFESEVTMDKESDKVDTGQLTSLVIGGVYAGDGDKETYYRLDIKGNTSDYLNILRNHSYTINIVKIKGSGYDEPDEAFNSKPINMEAEIVDWNDAQVGNIHESDGYNLSIYPESEFQFYKFGGMQEVALTTNHPLGWKVTEVSDSWITIDKAIDAPQGKNGEKVTMRISAPTYTLGADRVGYIHVQFARTAVKLTITQSSHSEPVLTITSNGAEVTELLFTTGGEDAEPQALDVKWLSDIGEMNIINNSESVTSPFVGKGVPATSTFLGAIGSTSFVISPTTTTLPVERETNLEFMVMNGETETKQNVSIKHINYGLDIKTESRYFLNGDTYSFTVKSNAPWEIESIKELASGKILDNKTDDNLKEGERFVANMVGETIYFTTADGHIEEASLEIVLASTDEGKLFVNHTITINFIKERPDGFPYPHQGWAGSNIYWDGEKMTFDDVGDKKNEQYQGLFFKWGSLWGVSPVDKYNSSTYIYSPDGTSGSVSDFESSGITSSWGSIETPTGSLSASVPERDYAYLTEQNPEPIIGPGGKAQEFGDICKYLSEKAIADGKPLHRKKWRMPTSNEFSTPRNYEKNESIIWEDLISNKTDGSFIIKNGWNKIEGDSEVFFPASGGRFNNTAVLIHLGTYGYAWTSSPFGSSDAYILRHNKDNVFPSFTYARFSAFPIRCVVDEILEE